MRTFWDKVCVPARRATAVCAHFEVGRKGGLSKAGFESSKPTQETEGLCALSWQARQTVGEGE